MEREEQERLRNEKAAKARLRAAEQQRLDEEKVTALHCRVFFNIGQAEALKLEEKRLKEERERLAAEEEVKVCTCQRLLLFANAVVRNEREKKRN